MTKFKVIIGANYGDEGKGRVTSEYTKKASGNVLNILTNGGAQRGHTVIKEGQEITNQHLGSGTVFGADNYFSEYFIINPLQFYKEYSRLLSPKPIIYRHPNCLWGTPWDMMAGSIKNKGKYASCGFGIWETIKRRDRIRFSDFIKLPDLKKLEHIEKIKIYYKDILIPTEYYDSWNSNYMIQHFLDDCNYLYENTIELENIDYTKYSDVILENGQGLLLCDTGEDDPRKTPSYTNSKIARELLKNENKNDITFHYITRPYLTRHGFGELECGENKNLTSYLTQDTNIFNEHQGEFRYGDLDLDSLKDRIISDSAGYNSIIEITHCDEMDRVKEFKKIFETVNTYDKPSGI